MIYNIDSINFVITGKNQKLVNLSVSPKDDPTKSRSMTFVTDEGMDFINGFEQPYNTHRLKILDSDLSSIRNSNDAETIFSLFDIKDVLIKSTLKKVGNSSVDQEKSRFKISDSEKFVERFGSHMDEDPIDFCQLGNTAIGLGKESSKTPGLKKTNLIDTRYSRLVENNNLLEWHYKLEQDENSTYTYVPLSNLVLNHRPDDPVSSYSDPDGQYFVAKSCKALSSEAYAYFFGDEQQTDLAINLESGTEPILFDHKGLDLTQIYEIDVDSNDAKNTLYNDHNAGTIRGNTFLGKNDFDATYSMNQKSVENLDHTRNYIGIGNVGNRLFLKYYDETSYEGTKQEKQENGITPIVSNKVSPTTNSYQNVEVLDSAVSFASNHANHKSNLYSIIIRNSGISPEATPALAEKMDVIKAQVSNVVRKITENLAPAHTQLFNVKFEDGSNVGS